MVVCALCDWEKWCVFEDVVCVFVEFFFALVDEDAVAHDCF